MCWITDRTLLRNQAARERRLESYRVLFGHAACADATGVGCTTPGDDEPLDPPSARSISGKPPCSARDDASCVRTALYSPPGEKASADSARIHRDGGAISHRREAEERQEIVGYLDERDVVIGQRDEQVRERRDDVARRRGTTDQLCRFRLNRGGRFLDRCDLVHDGLDRRRLSSGRIDGRRRRCGSRCFGRLRRLRAGRMRDQGLGDLRLVRLDFRRRDGVGAAVSLIGRRRCAHRRFGDGRGAEGHRPRQAGGFLISLFTSAFVISGLLVFGFGVFGAEETSTVEPAEEGRKGPDDSRLSRACRWVDLVRARLLVRITQAVGIADRTV